MKDTIMHGYDVRAPPHRGRASSLVSVRSETVFEMTLPVQLRRVEGCLCERRSALLHPAEQHRPSLRTLSLHQKSVSAAVGGRSTHH
jgi:hypothetical protein